MESQLTRPVDLHEHPLRKRTYRVPTPAIAAFRALVDDCLFLYVTGAAIHGVPRIGKSYAIEFLRRDLAKRYPKLAVFKLRCTRTQSPSESSFFSGLLLAAQHAAPHGTSRAALRGRLVQKLRQITDQNGDERVLLFADEAQNLREIEYEWLRDLHDELELHAMRLFVLLVGQPQLLAQKSAFQAQGKDQIVARFMVEELAFRGITTAEECAAVLMAYDKGEYPPHSDWSYTRFFVPRAHAAGLRLGQEAGRLWDAFEDAHIKANLPGSLEIPMKYFTTAVEAALLLSVDRDSETLKFDEGFWAEMVVKSRYVLAQRASHRPLTASGPG